MSTNTLARRLDKITPPEPEPDPDEQARAAFTRLCAGLLDAVDAQWARPPVRHIEREHGREIIPEPEREAAEAPLLRWCARCLDGTATAQDRAILASLCPSDLAAVNRQFDIGRDELLMAIPRVFAGVDG